jgi:nitrogen regulatory protein PII
MKDKPSFALVKDFTSKQQINLVVADSQKQQAIFVIHSYANHKTTTEDRLID